jgi:hypothetical protein
MARDTVQGRCPGSCLELTAPILSSTRNGLLLETRRSLISRFISSALRPRSSPLLFSSVCFSSSWMPLCCLPSQSQPAALPLAFAASFTPSSVLVIALPLIPSVLKFPAHVPCGWEWPQAGQPYSPCGVACSYDNECTAYHRSPGGCYHGTTNTTCSGTTGQFLQRGTAGFQRNFSFASSGFDDRVWPVVGFIGSSSWSAIVLPPTFHSSNRIGCARPRRPVSTIAMCPHSRAACVCAHESGHGCQAIGSAVRLSPST